MSVLSTLRRGLSPKLGAVFAVGLLAGVAIGVGGNLSGGSAAASTAATAEPLPAIPPVPPAATAPQTVAIDAELARLVRIEAVDTAPISRQVRVAASVEADEQRVSRIGSAVAGRVVQVFVQVGDAVKAGQTLAEVSSPELSTAQMNYLQALTQLQLAERAVERARLLLAADVIGSAELQRRESELAAAQAAVSAHRSLLKSVGMTPDAVARLAASREIAPTVRIASTRSGVVVERKVSQGQVVSTSDPVFTVADLSQVWIVAEVPERSAAGLRVGERVQAVVPTLGDAVHGGTLAFVSQTVDPETRTVRVRMDVPNRGGALKPAMLAAMLIDDESGRELAVPRDAVVRVADREHVFVQSAPDRVRLVPVRLGDEADGLRPVLAGLEHGERVVTAGAFHVNAARLQSRPQ